MLRFHPLTTNPTNTVWRLAAEMAPPRSLELRTSESHPLSVTWLFPNAFGAADGDLLDRLLALGPRLSSPSAALADGRRTRGNVALSSCPGKKVRVNGPVLGRAGVCRDLRADFARLVCFGIRAVFCLIGDEELELLGAPKAGYISAAQNAGLLVYFSPIPEGGHPERPADLETVLVKISELLDASENVLIHCRGGLGRAGLVAACLLLKHGLVKPVRESVGPLSPILYCSPRKELRVVPLREVDALKDRLELEDGKEAEESHDGDCAWTQIMKHLPVSQDLRPTPNTLNETKRRSPIAAARHIPFLNPFTCTEALLPNPTTTTPLPEDWRASPTNSFEIDPSRRAIHYVRLRRSHKAIETRQQEEFVAQYARYCLQRM